MAILCCRDLSLGYDRALALEHVSFQVEQGDYVCIVGENGSGKSTLLKGLLGLLPLRGGRVELGEGLQNHQIGYLPQQSPAQRDFPASVWEVVLSGCLNSQGLRPFYGAAAKERARSMLEKLDLLPLRNRCFRSLSGGQQQRVLLCRALCASEKLLMLDEPAASLDPAATASLYDLLQELNRQGCTILMVSHDLSAALSHGGKVLHLGHTLLFYGSAEEYRRSPLVQRYWGGSRHV
jgi:zinc transport system ATP-binding protein